MSHESPMGASNRNLFRMNGQTYNGEGHWRCKGVAVRGASVRLY